MSSDKTSFADALTSGKYLQLVSEASGWHRVKLQWENFNMLMAHFLFTSVVAIYKNIQYPIFQGFIKAKIK